MTGPGIGGPWGAQMPFGSSAFPGTPTWGTSTGKSFIFHIYS